MLWLLWIACSPPRDCSAELARLERGLDASLAVAEASDLWQDVDGMSWAQLERLPAAAWPRHDQPGAAVPVWVGTDSVEVAGRPVAGDLAHAVEIRRGIASAEDPVRLYVAGDVPTSRVRQLLSGLMVDGKGTVDVVVRDAAAPTVAVVPIPVRYRYAFDADGEFLVSAGPEAFHDVLEPCEFDWSAVRTAAPADKPRLFRDGLVAGFPSCGCDVDIDDWLWAYQLKYVHGPVLRARRLGLVYGIPAGPDVPWSTYVVGLGSDDATLVIGSSSTLGGP